MGEPDTIAWSAPGALPGPKIMPKPGGGLTQGPWGPDAIHDYFDPLRPPPGCRRPIGNRNSLSQTAPRGRPKDGRAVAVTRQLVAR